MAFMIGHGHMMGMGMMMIKFDGSKIGIGKIDDRKGQTIVISYRNCDLRIQHQWKRA
jgi:hypothetical protein